MPIRTETPADHPAVADVVRAAFEGEAEVRLIDLIRRSEHFEPSLSLVAEDDGGSVVGHVLFSRVGLEGEGPAEVYSLAPLAVHPDHQRRGIGSALTREGLRRLDAIGAPLVVVLGHPAYYPRFGFEPAVRHGILAPDPGFPEDAFKVKRLSAYDPATSGTIVYPDAFHPAEEAGP